MGETEEATQIGGETVLTKQTGDLLGNVLVNVDIG